MDRKFYKLHSENNNGGYFMGTVTIIGCVAAAVVGLTQVYKGVVGAVEEFKRMKSAKEEVEE